MKCPNCNVNLRKVKVDIEGAERKALSLQCHKCDYFEFDEKSSKEVIKELKIKSLFNIV